jgi:flagellar biosynthesis/type III secretory pathway chaperone
LLVELRDLSIQAHHPLVNLDLVGVERFVEEKKELLVCLTEAGTTRIELQERCLPKRARGLFGSTGLAATVTLHALITRAPTRVADRLCQQRDSLRQLRDEISAISARNGALTDQVLEMTDHLGEGLQAASRTASYTASGQGTEVTISGDLFSRAI